MTISYPISLPASPAPMSLRLDQRNMIGVSTSGFTGQQEVQEFQGKLWTAHAAWDANNRAQLMPIIAALASLHGPLGTFYLGDPAAATPLGIATGTPLVSGTNNARSKTLATKGWTHNVTGILKAGDYIQLGSGVTQRFHQVLADANSDNSGLATLDIWPTLREQLADGAAIVTASCKGTFRLAGQSTGWDISKPALYTVAIDAIEAF